MTLRKMEAAFENLSGGIVRAELTHTTHLDSSKKINYRERENDHFECVGLSEPKTVPKGPASRSGGLQAAGRVLSPPAPGTPPL